MDLAGTARMFAWQALWRGASLPRAGRALVEALNSADENVRTIAGMFLVQAGRRSLAPLREALDRRQNTAQNTAMILSILGSLGGEEAEAMVSAFVNDGDPEVARAAQDALPVIARRKESR